jgi:hypothetical protein
MRALLCVLLAVAGCAKRDDGGGIARGGIPDDWTHKELVEHLNGKGLAKKFLPASSGGVLGPAGYLVPADSNLTAEDVRAAFPHPPAEGLVYCALRRTPQEAKDDAGTAGADAFAAGRFVFRGPPAELRRIREALP